MMMIVVMMMVMMMMIIIIIIIVIELLSHYQLTVSCCFLGGPPGFIASFIARYCKLTYDDCGRPTGQKQQMYPVHHRWNFGRASACFSKIFKAVHWGAHFWKHRQLPSNGLPVMIVMQYVSSSHVKSIATLYDAFLRFIWKFTWHILAQHFANCGCARQVATSKGARWLNPLIEHASGLCFVRSGRSGEVGDSCPTTKRLNEHEPSN